MTSVMNQGTAGRERTVALAVDVEQVTGDLLTVVRTCNEKQWARITSAEQWSVGVVAHHMAEVAGFFTGVVAGVVSGSGKGVVLSDEEIDDNNARHAAQYAGVERGEVIALLEQRGPALTDQIRLLNDVQLSRIAGVFGGNPLTVGLVIELGVVGHFTEHLASIRATIGEGE